MAEQYYTIYNIALKKYNEALKEFLYKYIRSGKRCIAFSTNIISEMTINYLKNTPLDVEFIVDNGVDNQGKEIYGKRVFSPKVLKERFDDSYIILIASSFQNEMITQLEEYGYKMNEHIIKLIDLPELMSDYSHVNRSGMKVMTREEIKASQIGILKALKEYSERYRLRYYLGYGTALGAVRHGGYIPWDDDVDILIPINDLIKLIKILEKDDRYKIISQFNTDYYYGWGFGYMVDCNTICDINKFPVQLSTGQSVDIFPLYGLPATEYDRALFIKEVEKLESDCIINFADDAARIKSIKKFNELLMKFDYNECEIVGNVPFYKDLVYDKKMFGEGIEMKFEETDFKIPSDYDEYLKQTYGDYMKLPPKEKQKGEHFYHTYKK